MISMGILSRLARLFFVVSLPLLFISIGIRSVAFGDWFYERGFDTYGISRTTGIERAELTKAGKALIAYFESPEQRVSIEVRKDGKLIPLFNEREVGHLQDVKELFELNSRVGEVTGLYIVAYALTAFSLNQRRAGRTLANLAFQGSVLTLGILVLLGIGSLIDFESLFVQFHVISFRNDLWMLDPSRDYLIMMFPAGFWVDATLAVGTIAAMQGLLAGGVSYVYLRKRQQNLASGVRLAPH